MNEEGLRQKLSAEFKMPPKAGVWLITVDPELLNVACVHTTVCLTKQLGWKGIYVTLNKPLNLLAPKLESFGTDLAKLRFIDCASLSAGVHDVEATRSLQAWFVQSPAALTELSLVFTDLVNKEKLDFVVLDSLSMLLVHNNLKTTQQFLHYVVNKMRAIGIMGILLTTNDSNARELLPILTELTDKQIKC